ncbi:hypothetical protein ERY430_80432 [Erythrobacter sp. EC-HK427]|nr:hypothetical protein ERY430_80432 [Erythrobacter sp. EC-HK427]
MQNRAASQHFCRFCAFSRPALRAYLQICRRQPRLALAWGELGEVTRRRFHGPSAYRSSDQF